VASPNKLAQRHLEVQADDRELSAVRDFVAAACADLGFSAERAWRTSGWRSTRRARTSSSTPTAGRATLRSASRHGAAGSRSAFSTPATVRWQVDVPHLGQLVDTKRRGGLGVFLMSRLMDEVRYPDDSSRQRMALAQAPAGAAVGVHAPHAPSLWHACRGRFGRLTRSPLRRRGSKKAARRTRAEEARLVAHAFGLAKRRAVLLQRAELSPEQTHPLRSGAPWWRKEPRLVAVSVVDADGTIWAADRAAATFTRS
jgi:hypothetical protein